MPASNMAKEVPSLELNSYPPRQRQMKHAHHCFSFLRGTPCPMDVHSLTLQLKPVHCLEEDLVELAQMNLYPQL